MLISCPKCHSIYEIPDDLIGKTGQNFRCHACANVWHAMREDALGYEQDIDTPYIESIEVKTPPTRKYPADKKEYTVPADTKSGRRTVSSEDLIKHEGNADLLKKKKNKKEITLTSDYGTSFTISAVPDYEDPEAENTPHFFDNETSEIRADKENRLALEKSATKGCLLSLLLFTLTLALLVVFLRREVVAFYPDAENWYNQIYLSGLNNPEYLKFENVYLDPKEDSQTAVISADIINPSRYGTYVPDITINNTDKTFKAKDNFVAAHGKTSVTITIPMRDTKNSLNLTIGFKK